MGRDMTPSFAPNCANLPKPLPVGKRTTTPLCHVCHLCWFHCTRAPQCCPRHALHSMGCTPLKADTGRTKILTGTSSALRGKKCHPRVEEDGGHCPGFTGGGHILQNLHCNTHTHTEAVWDSGIPCTASTWKSRVEEEKKKSVDLQHRKNHQLKNDNK